MVKRIAPGIGFLLAAWTALAGGGARADSPPNGVDFFEAKIRPVLAEHCYECHSAKAKKLRGGLRLDSRARLLAGGDRGAGRRPRRPRQEPPPGGGRLQKPRFADAERR